MIVFGNYQRRKMKRFSALILGLIFLLPLTGCKSDMPSIVQRTDLYYQLIRTFVTDPAVHPLFTEQQIKKLRDIEKVYLAASESLKNATDTTPALYAIVDCGNEICAVLDSLESLPEKYRKEIPVIRAAMLAMRLGLIAHETNV
jgi:hypothetical protein